MKVALVYDRVNKWGGAERVLLALHEIWSQAPLFTSVYNSKTAGWAKVFPKIIPSFLQKFPWAKTSHEIFSPLMPIAFESLDLSGYYLIISVTSEAAKGVLTSPHQLHLCYCLTPTRYLWSGYDDYFKTEKSRRLSRLLISYLRKWDKIAGQRPDGYVAISKTVQSRIKNYYHRESEVIYPPIDTDKFEIRNPKSESNTKYLPCSPRGVAGRQAGKILNTKYFFVVSRLVKYKKVDLVIETFNRLGWNLKIAGTGRETNSLKTKAKNNIEFLGQLTDQQLLSYYQNCEAVIFPQEEDFGIVPLEAQACGKPVVAYRAGGAVETLIENRTGLFFDKQTVESLAAKLQSFKAAGYKAEDCREQAEKFCKEKFMIEFKKYIEAEWQKHLKNIFTR
ncbi:glycosyltransferase family 4 protein [Candidatus Shapirobacteria bacterium CG_4_8_14_3_um_filter_39_11]|uniref:Glycosyltransferase family 4 protein n=1 Tax=Candidatus Shapirobacteria bacterium CG_4_8_14_3_um_filter_39_11 TaxID=1974875 RepID=A0A2M8GFJ6_9BACT|nr:MAG: glycosyltransferase family 4 protein [Candidatus Shapirobacteria bacterium CG_4_8_14_3_um_filter_39_11]